MAGVFEKFSCEKCYNEGFVTTFDSLQDLQNHFYVCSSDIMRRCPFCANFIPNDTMDEHISAMHQETPVIKVKSEVNKSKFHVDTSMRPPIFQRTDSKNSQIVISSDDEDRRANSKKTEPMSNIFSQPENSEELDYQFASKGDRSPTFYTLKSTEVKSDIKAPSDDQDELEAIRQRCNAKDKSATLKKRVVDQGEESFDRLKTQAMNIVNTPLKSKLLTNAVKCNGQITSMSMVIMRSMVESKKMDLHQKSQGINVKKWAKERIREHLNDSGLTEINTVNYRTLMENIDRVKKSAEESYQVYKRLAETGAGELGDDVNEHLRPERDDGIKELTSEEKTLAELFEESRELDKQLLAKKPDSKKSPKEKKKNKIMDDLLDLDQGRPTKTNLDDASEESDTVDNTAQESDKKAQKRAADHRRLSADKRRRGEIDPDSSTDSTDYDSKSAVKKTFKKANEILDKASVGDNSNFEKRMTKNEQETASIKQEVAEVRKEVHDIKKELSQTKTEVRDIRKEVVETKKSVEDGNSKTHSQLAALLAQMAMKNNGAKN